VLPQQFVITDHSDPNEILRRKERNTLRLFLGMISLLSIGCLLTGFYFIFIGRDADSYALFICGFVGFVIAIKWRNRSNVRVIERAQIKYIQLKKVLFNYTFIVFFKNKKGKFEMRVLPMKLSNSEKSQKQ